MTRTVEVVNLSTGNNYIFVGDLFPVQAVNACFEQQENGNFNFWEYNKSLHLVKITRSGLHCYRGDYTARMKEEEKNDD